MKKLRHCHPVYKASDSRSVVRTSLVKDRQPFSDGWRRCDGFTKSFDSCSIHSHGVCNINQAHSEYKHSLTFRVRGMLSQQRNPCTDCKSAQ